MGIIKSTAGPLFHTLDFDLKPPSVANLPAALTINSVTVYPTLRYKGGDAGAVSWPAWGYGETLTLQAGTAPSYNQGSPLLGPAGIDDSVKFNAGGNYRATGTTGNVALEDFVVEVLFTFAGGSAARVVARRNGPGGWLFMEVTSTTVEFYLNIGATACELISLTTLNPGAIYHVMGFFDRSGSGGLYINAVYHGAVSLATITGDMTTTALLDIGADSNGSSLPCTSNVHYTAMWKQSAWLDTHLQATVAKTRFAQLTGVYPQTARGTALPSVMARTTTAYLDKIEADRTTKLYYVGANWPRVCSRRDTAGNVVRGYLSETEVANFGKYSQDLSNWTPTRATTPNTSIVCPDGIARTTVVIHEDNTASNTHYIQLGTVALSPNGVWCISFYAKAISRTYIYVETQSYFTAHAVFTLIGNGVATTILAAGSGIEKCENGWYRCLVYETFNWAGNAETVRLYVATSTLPGISFSGLNQDSVAVFGIQVEKSNYPSTYIPTTTGAVTRTADSLRYKMDDGNLTAGKGSLVVDFMGANINQAGSPEYLQISDGTSNNQLALMAASSGDDVSSLVITNGGGAQASIVGATDIWNGNKHTIRATWKTNSAKQYVDGAIDGTEDTVCTIPTGLTQLDVGAYLSAGHEANGLISNLKIFGLPTTKK